MTRAREAILNALRQRVRPVEMPSPWRRSRAFPDLAERFTQALTAAHGEVWRLPTWTAALDRLGTLLEELQARRVVVNPDPPLDTVDFAERWPERTWFIVGETAGDLRAFCARADVGISGAVAALAETGTVIVASSARHSRLATLLPPVHIALVPEARLVPDLFAWVAQRPRPFPANITLISGPSKSADIEQTLAVGVHGPQRFIVLLYG